MIVVADTTPLNYLILIGRVDLIAKLFGEVMVPPSVFEELQDALAPVIVRTVVGKRPSWMRVVGLTSEPDPNLSWLDRGEREAISLAEQLRADKLLVDETEARDVALRRKLSITGTLGVLRLAAQAKLIDLPSVVRDLQRTNFHVSAHLIDGLLKQSAD